MNYDKKRKRQKGHPVIGYVSERQKIYRKGYFDGRSALIAQLTEAGILPEGAYEIEKTTDSEIENEFETHWTMEYINPFC